MLLLTTTLAVAAVAAAVVRADDDDAATPFQTISDALAEAQQSGTSTMQALLEGAQAAGVAGELSAGLLSFYAGQSSGAQDVLAELTDTLGLNGAAAAGDDDGGLRRRAAQHDVVRSVMAFHEANRAVPSGAAAAYANASAHLMAANASRKRSIVPGLIDDVADGPLANLLRTLTGQERQALSKQRTLLRKAQPLECINSAGERTPTANGRCPPFEQPKRSGSYVWAVAQSRRNVFYGTINDVLCNFGLSDQCPQTERDRIFMQPFDDGCCKPAGPPLDITPDVTDTALSAIECVTRKSLSVAPWAKGAERFCLGIATQFALPLDLKPRAILYDGDTGELLITKRIDELFSVRTALVVGGRMFFGGAQPGGQAWGGVIEWLPTTNDALRFKLVADLTDQTATVSSLVFHEGRLFASTWSSLFSLLGPIGALAGNADFAGANALLGAVKPGSIVSSPPLKRVRKQSRGEWVVQTTTCDYDPNPFMCRLTSYHDINVHRNELYFATQNLIVTDLAAAAVLCPALLFLQGVPVPGQVCDANAADRWVSQGADAGRTACDVCQDIGNNPVAGILSLLRATSLFRASNLARGPTANLELLYGFYAFLDADGSLDVPVPYASGLPQLPQHGLAGFNNLFNGYTWQVESFDDKLWVGTWDYVGILNGLLTGLVSGAVGFDLQIELGTPGFDLYSLQRTRLSLNAESLDGFGNELNYGVFKLETLKCFTPANGDVDDANADFDLWHDDYDFRDDDNVPDTVASTTDDNVDDSTAFSMLVGTANPFSTEAEGGWELHCLVDEANL